MGCRLITELIVATAIKGGAESFRSTPVISRKTLPALLRNWPSGIVSPARAPPQTVSSIVDTLAGDLGSGSEKGTTS